MMGMDFFFLLILRPGLKPYIAKRQFNYGTINYN